MLFSHRLHSIRDVLPRLLRWEKEFHSARAPDALSLTTSEKVEHERKAWNLIFSREIANYKADDFSSFWWKDYYSEITRYFRKLLEPVETPSILEMGSGSGKASILLMDDHWRLTLMDISESALEYASLIARRWGKQNVQFLRDNFFTLKDSHEQYDLVWNLGVIEHYELDEIEVIMSEMIRRARQGALVAIGYPNFYSGPILKAWLLTKWPFSLLKGYRLDTERFLTRDEVTRCFERALEETGRSGSLDFRTVGSPLPMETPRWILRSLGRFLHRVLPRNRFLTFATCRINVPGK